jgi:hypothetical protein
MVGSLGGHFIFFPKKKKKKDNHLGVTGEIENTRLLCSPLSSLPETL